MRTVTTPSERAGAALKRGGNVAKTPQQQFDHARLLLAADREALQALGKIESTYYANRFCLIVEYLRKTMG